MRDLQGYPCTRYTFLPLLLFPDPEVPKTKPLDNGEETEEDCLGSESSSSVKWEVSYSEHDYDVVMGRPSVERVPVTYTHHKVSRSRRGSRSRGSF